MSLFEWAQPTRVIREKSDAIRRVQESVAGVLISVREDSHVGYVVFGELDMAQTVGIIAKAMAKITCESA